MRPSPVSRWPVLALLLLGTGVRAADWDARITEVQGEAWVTLAADGDEEGDLVRAEADMPLGPGDSVRTGDDGRAEIALADDSIFSMEPGSEFIVESLDARDSLFSLKLGAIAAKLRSLLDGQRLRVRTPTAVAAVRGTEFGVQVVGSEETTVAVFDEGQVEVEESGPESSPRRLLLSRNQETRVLGRGPGPESARRMSPRDLKDMLRYRVRVERLRERREVLRRGWKPLPPERRLELRRAMAEKWRALPPEQRRRLKERMLDDRRGGAPRPPSGTRGPAQGRQGERTSPAREPAFRRDEGAGTPSGSRRPRMRPARDGGRPGFQPPSAQEGGRGPAQGGGNRRPARPKGGGRR